MPVAPAEPGCVRDIRQRDNSLRCSLRLISRGRVDVPALVERSEPRLQRHRCDAESRSDGALVDSHRSPDPNELLAQQGRSQRAGACRRPPLPLTPTLPEAIAASSAEPYLLYSGKHHDHGVNVQALTTTSDQLLLLGAAPGLTHDLTTAPRRLHHSGRHRRRTWRPPQTPAARTPPARTPFKRPKSQGHNDWEIQASSTSPGSAPLPSAPPPNWGAGGGRPASRPHRDHTNTFFIHRKAD